MQPRLKRQPVINLCTEWLAWHSWLLIYAPILCFAVLTHCCHPLFCLALEHPPFSHSGFINTSLFSDSRSCFYPNTLKRDSKEHYPPLITSSIRMYQKTQMDWCNMCLCNMQVLKTCPNMSLSRWTECERNSHCHMREIRDTLMLHFSGSASWGKGNSRIDKNHFPVMQFLSTYALWMQQNALALWKW